MNKIYEEERGFTVIEGLLIVLVLAVMGFGGYYVWHSQQTALTTAKSSATAPKTTTKTTNNTSTATTTSAYTGWKTYTLPVEKLSFMYPSDWTVSNTAPTSTQDNTTLTSNDGFTLNIEDGVSNGGDAIPEAASDAIAVTFVGQSDYLVPTYGSGSVGQGSSDGMIAGAELQTSTNEQSGPDGEYPLPTDKYAVGPNDTTGAVNAKYISISCDLATQITLQQVSNNSDLKNAELVIASMHY